MASLRVRRGKLLGLVVALLALAGTHAGAAKKPDVQALHNQVLKLSQEGKHAEASQVAERLLPLLERQFGADSPVTAESRYNLALLYQYQGRYAEAEPLYKRALPVLEKALGRNNVTIAGVAHNIATLYRVQGRYAEAEPYYKRALAILETAKGQPLHIAQVLHDLGLIYQNQGRYAEAEPYYKRAIPLREKALPADHVDLAWSRYNLANAYQMLGRYDEAEPLYEQTIPAFEKAFGPKHANVGAAINDLGMLRQRQGRYDEAGRLYKQSFDIRLEALGPDHADVGASLHNLANLYQLQGRYLEAKPLYERSLLSLEKAMGPEHPTVAAALNDIAMLEMALGRYAEAEPLYKRSLAVREKALGPDHADVGASLHNLGNLYQVQGRFAEAEPLYKRSHTVLETALGPDHTDVAASLNAMAMLYEAQDRKDEVESIYQRALAIREKALGPDHPDTGASLHNLANYYSQIGRYEEAAPLFERAVANAEKALGPEHRDLAHMLTNLATVRWIQGREADAESLWKRAISIFEKTLGPDHPYFAAALHDFAGLHFIRKDWAKAAELLELGTDILVRRTRRGAETSLGQRLTGQGKSDVAQAFLAFVALVRTQYHLAQADKSRAAELARKAFVTAQYTRDSDAAASLAQMAARQAKGETALALVVRERQDLVAEWQTRDRLLSAALGQPPEARAADVEEELRRRLAEIDARIAEIDKTLQERFPDYAALARPEPVPVDAVQAELRDDEALVLILDMPALEPSPKIKMAPEETFIWVVTRTADRWMRSDLGSKTLAERVQALRCGLDETAWSGEGAVRCRQALGLEPGKGWQLGGPLPFDLARAHDLYKALFGEVEDLIKGKHLLLVPSGALTSLPFQVLTTAPPAGGDLAAQPWLIRDHALTVLPSVSSLAALRRNARGSAAADPFIGFGDPVLTRSCGAPIIPDKCPEEKVEVAAASNVVTRSAGPLDAVGDFFRGGLADVVAVKTRLCPLPDTAHELKCVSKSLGAGPGSLVLGKEMTETAVKTMPLDRYRVVHFATHGLLAGETAELASSKAEPSLVFSPPDKASEQDDGLLTASEVAGLKLDADWVVMSACNTAGGAGPGAEALSGLARSFFYAGTRALLVSHWPVSSYAATMLTSRTFAEMKKDPTIGRSEAFRRAMLALMSDKERPWTAHPSVWSPFVVVGEGSVAAAR